MEDEDKVEELLNNIQNKDEASKDSIRQLALMLSLLLNSNPWIHLLITLVINFIVSITIIGFFDGKIIFVYGIVPIIYAVLIFTAIEFIIKMIIYYLAPLLMIYTLGVIFFIGHAFIYYFIDYIIEGFDFMNIGYMLLYTLIFDIFRYALVVSGRKFINNYLTRRNS